MLLLSACGYQFRVEGPGPTIGGTPAGLEPKPDAPMLSIAPFDNKSVEPNLELKYTAYARREFSYGSGARIVSGHDGDFVLRGRIISVIVPTLAFELGQTLESRVTVFVHASVEKAKTREVIWRQTVTASSEFFVTRDLQFNRVLQTRALEQAGVLVAQDLASRFLHHLEHFGLAPAPPGAYEDISVPTNVPGATPSR